MKILVFGSTGMLGHTLVKYLQSKKYIKIEFTARDERKQEICKKTFGREAKFLVDAFNPKSAWNATSEVLGEITSPFQGIISTYTIFKAFQDL